MSCRSCDLGAQRRKTRRREVNATRLLHHSRHLRHRFPDGAAQRAGAQSNGGRTPAVTFARDIQPILEKNCAACHSGDLKLAELDLSNREAAMRGGEHGAVIVAGNSEKSKLYRMVAGLDQPVMPMEGDPLKPTEVAAIKAWIDQGATWDAPAVSFAKDIQPIMERSCWNCHGESMQLSKLDLRTREGALRGGAHGPAIDARQRRAEPAVSRGRAPRRDQDADAGRQAEAGRDRRLQGLDRRRARRGTRRRRRPRSPRRARSPRSRTWS